MFAVCDIHFFVLGENYEKKCFNDPGSEWDVRGSKKVKYYAKNRKEVDGYSRGINIKAPDWQDSGSKKKKASF